MCLEVSRLSRRLQSHQLRVRVRKQGVVSGDITTQDAVISGRVEGTLVAASRLELQSTCHIEGEVHTRRMQLEEGAVLNGSVHMGAESPKVAEKAAEGAVILAMLPDTGERYLSTYLFEGMNEGSDDEWLASL